MLSLLHLMADYKCHLETTCLHISICLRSGVLKKEGDDLTRLICHLIYWHNNDSLFLK